MLDMAIYECVIFYLHRFYKFKDINAHLYDLSKLCLSDVGLFGVTRFYDKIK